MLGEARWLAEQGVREIVLVSENSTSYGKDLGDMRLLETLLPELAAVEGIERVRVSYLQPAEMRPGLIDVLTATAGVVPYFDLSFQHSAAGGAARGCAASATPSGSSSCSTRIRAKAPAAGVRSNFIVGFPGETEEDFAELERFLTDARLDAIGVFGYSDEDGTEAAASTASSTRTRSPTGVAQLVAAGRGADRAARRASASATRSRCWSSARATATGVGRGPRPPTRRPRPTARRS